MFVFFGSLTFYLLTVSTIILFDVLTTPVISSQVLTVAKGHQVLQET